MSISMDNAAGETRRSMLRVWFAISAVWVAFWLSISLLVMISVGTHSLLSDRAGTFVVILLAPPIVFLAGGAISRRIFEALSKSSNA